MKIAIMKIVLMAVVLFVSGNVFSQSMYSLQSELPSEQSATSLGIGYESGSWDGNLPSDNFYSDNFYSGDNVLRGPIIADPENPTVAPISGGVWFLLLIAAGYGFFVYARSKQRVKL